MAIQKYKPHVKTETGYADVDFGQINVYVHNYNAATKTHNLVGSGSNIQFMPTAAWTIGDKMTINGVPVPVKAISNNEVKLIVDASGTTSSTLVPFKPGVLMTDAVFWGNTLVIARQASNSVLTDSTWMYSEDSFTSIPDGVWRTLVSGKEGFIEKHTTSDGLNGFARFVGFNGAKYIRTEQNGTWGSWQTD